MLKQQMTENSVRTMQKIAHISRRFCCCRAGAAFFVRRSACDGRFCFFVFAIGNSSERDQALISATISAMATASQQ